MWVRVPRPVLNMAKLIKPFTDKAIQRFWKKVQKRRWNQCWIWQGPVGSRGYGCFKFSCVNWQAHRIAYYLYYNEDPGDFCVCHSCDVPLCVNPRHLWLGTHTDNMQDMITKGRRVQPNVHGEKNPSSKLTQKQVNQIRKLYTTKKYTYMQLAEKFNVSYVTIHHIVTHKTWSL